MQLVETIDSLRAELNRWRAKHATIALVPTMGNLHRGHLMLVDAARELADKVVATIFVNPTQFGEGEDFDSYPRTLTADMRKLRQHKTDLLFVPEVNGIYPRNGCTVVDVADLSKELCGQARPQHFVGVATVVCKLFNMVQPDIAVFGEKDFQQLVLIRRMVGDLNIPVAIQGIATVREADGLALSSRNAYLTRRERQLAPTLYRTLCGAQQAIDQGERDYRRLEKLQLESLNAAGFKPDYFCVRRVSDLRPAAPNDIALVILTAARLGKPRLIDNLQVTVRD